MLQRVRLKFLISYSAVRVRVLRPASVANNIVIHAGPGAQYASIDNIHSDTSGSGESDTYDSGHIVAGQNCFLCRVSCETKISVSTYY